MPPRKLIRSLRKIEFRILYTLSSARDRDAIREALVSRVNHRTRHFVIEPERGVLILGSEPAN